MAQKGKGVTLSKKHGVNPTICVCWWCGEDRNEIALLGKEGEKVAKAMGRSDGDMPLRACLDKEPCDKCQELLKKGIFLFEVESEAPQGVEPVRTGRMWVVSRESSFWEMLKVDKEKISRIYATKAQVAELIGDNNHTEEK